MTPPDVALLDNLDSAVTDMRRTQAIDALHAACIHSAAMLLARSITRDSMRRTARALAYAIECSHAGATAALLVFVTLAAQVGLARDVTRWVARHREHVRLRREARVA